MHFKVLTHQCATCNVQRATHPHMHMYCNNNYMCSTIPRSTSRPLPHAHTAAPSSRSPQPSASTRFRCRPEDFNSLVDNGQMHFPCVWIMQFPLECNCSSSCCCCCYRCCCCCCRCCRCCAAILSNCAHITHTQHSPHH